MKGRDAPDGAPPPRGYRILLLLLPRGLRARFQHDMWSLLRARLEEAGESRPARARVWLRAVIDVVRVAWQERTAGTPERAEALVRGVVAGFVQDTRHAIRSLARSPGFAAATVLTLAVGTGAPTAVFTVVNSTLLRPLPYPDADELVLVNSRWLAPTHVDHWREDTSVLRSLALYTIDGGTARVGDRTVPVRVMPVGEGFFEVLGVSPERGRGLGPADHRPGAPPVAMVSRDFLRDHFGDDPEPSGRTVELDGVIHDVVGVLPADFTFHRYEDVDLWVPLPAGPVRASGAARLAPGVTPAEAARRLGGVARRLAADAGGAELPDGVAPVRVVGMHEALVGDVRTPLLVFLAASVLVMLIACANAANLLLGRGLRRADELAVRRALGAGRRRLVGQLLVEAGVLAVFAAGLGIVLAGWGTPALIGAAPGYIPGEPVPDLRVFAFTAALAGLVTVGAGLLPAVLSAGRAPSGSRGTALAGRRGPRRWEDALVAGQVALTLVLLTGTALLLRTYSLLRPERAGFAVDDRVVVTVELPEHRFAEPGAIRLLADDALRALEAVPGVRSATLVTHLPLTGVSEYVPVRELDGSAPDPDARSPLVHLRASRPGYLELMEMTIVQGRSLRSARPGEPAAVVNEEAVRRLWPGVEAPLGHTVTFDGPEGPTAFTVVGVAEDTRIFGGSTAPRPEVFVPFDLRPQRRFRLVAATAGPLSGASVRETLRAVDPHVPVVEVVPFEQMAGESLRVQRFQLLLVGTLGSLALLLATVGAAAVVGSVVARRRREIGIRRALGAPRAGVVGLMLRQGAVPVALGMAAGLALSVALAHLVESRSLAVPAADPVSLAGAVAVLVGASASAILVPSLRASTVDPLHALREE